MNGLTDIFGNPLLIPAFAFITIVIIAFVLFYVFRLKPRLQYALKNERVVADNVTFWAPRGHGVMSGPLQTARMTIERFWSQLIENENNESLKKNWVANRAFILKKYVFAMKDNSGNKILLFDLNPEDQKFLSMDPEGAGMILHGVQDCNSVGKHDGFEYLSLKLNADVQNFTDEELKESDACLNTLMFLRDAAKNTEKISELQEAFDDKERAHKKALDELADTRSKLDRALSALGMKPLTQREEPKLKGGVTTKVKEFFWTTPWQLGTALVGFLAAPYIIQLFNITLDPPLNFQIFSGVMAAIGFFIIPVFKKIFGRWL